MNRNRKAACINALWYFLGVIFNQKLHSEKKKKKISPKRLPRCCALEKEKKLKGNSIPTIVNHFVLIINIVNGFWNSAP